MITFGVPISYTIESTHARQSAMVTARRDSSHRTPRQPHEPVASRCGQFSAALSLAISSAVNSTGSRGGAGVGGWPVASQSR